MRFRYIRTTDRTICPFRTRPPVYRIYGRTPLPKALMRYLKSRRS